MLSLVGWPWTSHVAAMTDVASSCASSDPAVDCSTLHITHSDVPSRLWRLGVVAVHPNCGLGHVTEQWVHRAYSAAGSAGHV